MSTKQKLENLEKKVLTHAKAILWELHKDFINSLAIVKYPLMNKIVSFDTLAARVTEDILGINQDNFSNALELVRNILEQNLHELNNYITEHKLRVRIGGIDLF